MLGVRELDDVLGHIPLGYVVLVEGRPGTGKTTFAVSTVCRNVREGNARVLYVTTNEGFEKLKEVAKGVGCDLESLVAEKRVRILGCPTIGDEYLVEAITEEVMKHVLEGYDMVVIDSVTPLMRVLNTYARKRAWLHTVIYKIASTHKVTVMLICDTLTPQDPDVSLLEYLADVVIRFDFNPTSILPRSLHVLKFRARAIPPAPLYFHITPKGFHVINAVSSELAERLRSVRKDITIGEEPASKLLGPNLRPGTQVSMIINYPASSLGLLHKYLVLKVGLEAIRKNLKVAIIYFGRRKGTHKIPEEGIMGKLLGNNLVEVPVDIMYELAPRPSLKGVDFRCMDIIVESGYERLAEIYGVREVNKVISMLSLLDSKLGITAFRIFRIMSPSLRPPSAMLTLSDVVIEASLNRRGEGLELKVIKGDHILQPLSVLDTELKHAVEKLAKELRSAMKDHGGI